MRYLHESELHKFVLKLTEKALIFTDTYVYFTTKNNLVAFKIRNKFSIDDSISISAPPWGPYIVKVGGVTLGVRN